MIKSKPWHLGMSEQKNRIITTLLELCCLSYKRTMPNVLMLRLEIATPCTYHHARIFLTAEKKLNTCFVCPKPLPYVLMQRTEIAPRGDTFKAVVRNTAAETHNKG